MRGKGEEGGREGMILGVWVRGRGGEGREGEEKKRINVPFFFEVNNLVYHQKQVITIGKKTGCAVELHPVEIIYNPPSILLFCRYANALRTLPDPLGRLHLKRSRRGPQIKQHIANTFNIQYTFNVIKILSLLQSILSIFNILSILPPQIPIPIS